MLRCIYIVYIYSQIISVFSNIVIYCILFYCLYHMFLFTALLDTLSFDTLNNLSIMIYDLNSLLYLNSVAKLLY